MTVLKLSRGRTRAKVIKEGQVYTTKLLPGFELPLAALLAWADYWEEDDEEEVDDQAGRNRSKRMTSPRKDT